MVKKITAAGLGKCHLDLVYKRGGPDGLVAISKDDFSGKSRVTKDKRIDLSSISHLSDKQGQK